MSQAFTTQRAVSETPTGDQPSRGLSLPADIPGQSTHAKPVDDTRRRPNRDEPIWRITNPTDKTKEHSRVDVRDVGGETSYFGLGTPNPPTKTQYPYRDDTDNTYKAAAFVVELWRLEGAPTLLLSVDSSIRTSTTLEQILEGLDTKFKERSLGCSAALKRVDPRNLRWIFSVNCGNGAKAVKVRAVRRGSAVHFTKLDLELSCSCPAWQWLGPEFHARQEAFQLGKARGTASPPNIRDPERDNRVCKHVAAVLATTRQWVVPRREK